MMERNPLAILIAEEIQGRGPISFARFMERALLEPGIGYYATQQVRAGRSGDFMTAPELHPLLGSAIARLTEECWRRLGRPHPFRWIEFGAGSGALLLAAMAHLGRERSPLLNAMEIEPVVANPFRRSELEASVAALPQQRRPRLVQRNAATRGVIAGIVVANEFLDALPFHVVVGRAAAPRGFLERRVGVDSQSEVVPAGAGRDPGGDRTRRTGDDELVTLVCSVAGVAGGGAGRGVRADPAQAQPAWYMLSVLGPPSAGSPPSSSSAARLTSVLLRPASMASGVAPGMRTPIKRACVSEL